MAGLSWFSNGGTCLRRDGLQRVFGSALPVGAETPRCVFLCSPRRGEWRGRRSRERREERKRERDAKGKRRTRTSKGDERFRGKRPRVATIIIHISALGSRLVTRALPRACSFLAGLAFRCATCVYLVVRVPRKRGPSAPRDFLPIGKRISALRQGRGNVIS